MYLKCLMLVLCCAIGNAQACCLKKKTGSKSTGALPTVVAVFKSSGLSSSSPCPVVPQEDLDAPCPVPTIAVPAVAPVQRMFYDFPGGNSPVYWQAEECAKHLSLLCGPTSPLRVWFPCGR